MVWPAFIPFKRFRIRLFTLWCGTGLIFYFDSDLDVNPTFHVDAYPDADLTFHFDADTVPVPHQSDENLRPLLYFEDLRINWMRLWPFMASCLAYTAPEFLLWCWSGSASASCSWLWFGSGSTSQNDADPCESYSGSATLAARFGSETSDTQSVKVPVGR